MLVAAVEGAPVADVGMAMHLSPSTVRGYLSDAIGKTETRSRAEAVRMARENRWL